MESKSRMASILQTVTDVDSKENTFNVSSKSTGSLFIETGDLKEVTYHDGKVMIENIVDSIFDANMGLANISSSQPSLTDTFESSEDMDVRLKRWQNTLRDRLKMQAKIFRKTGKNPNEMLCNLPVSLEQRDKGTLHRLMDFANRMNPVTLHQKQPASLPMRFNKCTGKCVSEVRETLPQAEQTGKMQMEFIGLPLTTKKEILSPLRGFRGPKFSQKTKWLNSKVLEEQIVEKNEDIKRVLEFCPNIGKLEVVGNNNNALFHNDDIDLLHSEEIITVSSSTDLTVLDSLVMGDVPQQPQSKDINVGIKINDKVYSLDQKRNVPVGELQFYFECEPYQIDVKDVVRLENVGKKVMICSWLRNYDAFKQSQESEEGYTNFLFDHKLIMLFPGDVYISKALFQPVCVMRSKERWELKLFPNIFCGNRGSLIVQLNGNCKPSSMYAMKLDFHLQFVIDKCNDQILRKLCVRQGKLAPSIEKPHILCPYKRDLDERELFNAMNFGYHCERYEDLENLRALYNALKMPRSPAWDLRLDTIRNLIMGMPIPEFRESYFQKLIKIQDSLKSYGDSQFVSFDHAQERKRSRLIYVRGCIANGIEEWEELMASIEESCLKSEFVTFWSQARTEDLENSKLEIKLLKNLRAKKYYRDSLYIHTYTLMCDIAENMVSIIESTEFV